MYLINSLEFYKRNNEWIHESTRVLGTCVDVDDAKRKMDGLKALHTKRYKQEYKLQKLGEV